MRRFLPLLVLFALLLSGCGVQSTPTPVAPTGPQTASPVTTPGVQSSTPVRLLSRKAIQLDEPNTGDTTLLPMISDSAPLAASGVPEGWTTLLDDDFQDPDPDVWGTGEIEGGSVELAEGELRIRAEKGWQISSYPTVAEELKDGYISATFRASGKGRAGVLARFTATEDDSTMYICWLEAPRSFGCHKYVDGVWRELIAAQSQQVRTTGQNTLALQFVGSNLLLAINGKNVASVADRDLASGAWGVFAEGGTATMQARFSKVLIAAPPAGVRATPTTSRPQPQVTVTPGAAGHLFGLDPGFGDSGKITMDLGSGLDEVHDVVVQPDGKIIAGGEAWPKGNPSFSLARFNPDGSPDTSYGDAGTVITTLIEEYDYSSIRALALQPDGKLLAAGPARHPETRRPAFGLVRYTQAGRLDTSFGDGGKVTTQVTINPGYSIADEAEAVAIAPDGKILVAGPVGSFPSDFGLVRFLPNGDLDESFGDGGRVITDFGYEDRAHALAIQPDGKILVAGHGALHGESLEDYNFALARYNTDGGLDTSFGDGGKVTTDLSDFQDEAHAMALRPDGKIAVGGLAVNGARGCQGTACWTYGMALAQYNADGSLDTAFGAGGKVVVEGQWSAGYDLLRLPDGTLALGGYVGETDFGLALFDASGKPLPGFGTDGILRTAYGLYKDRINALALQPDGRIVAAGSAVVDPQDILNGDFALVRYK